MAHRHLSLTPLDDARAALLGAAEPLAGSELVPALESLGRVTAARVVAREPVPHYHGAAMDGIAVRAADTAAARAEQPVELELGSPASVARPFSYVETGNALPSWADAVVMIERVFPGRAPAAGARERGADGVVPGAVAHGDGCCADDAGAPLGAAETVSAARATSRPGERIVHLRAPAPPWQHVRLVGEDVAASEPLLPRGHRIRPYDVAALLAAGVVTVEVRPRPVVAILPTGDELIEPGDERRPGRIVEFNSRMLAAFVLEWGGEPVRLAPVGDNRDAIATRIAVALRDADVVCVIAGSSAGAHDFSAQALGGVGRILAHGIAVMPGKPAIVAAIGRGPDASGRTPRARVALGIPGYPVSAAVVCRELVEPLLAHLLGRAPLEPATIRAVATRPLASRTGQQELIRVVVGQVGERTVVEPLARGAGAITTMARADGVVRIGADVAAIEAGATVEVELLRPLGEVRRTILVSGSDDPALAVLEDVLRASVPGTRLALASVGSVAGVLAVARGEAHVAAVASGDLADLAGDAPPGGARARDAGVVVHLLARDVGLVVAPGNPLGLRSAADLLRDGVRTPPEVERSAVRFLRRGGATTGGRREHPDGGERREITPIAVATAVQSGLADAGLAPASVAAALGLGFVPLAREDYVLVLAPAFATSARGRALRAAAASAAFRDAAARLPGCDAARSGAESSVADLLAHPAATSPAG